MKALVMAATLVAGHYLLSPSSAFAQERYGVILTPHRVEGLSCMPIRSVD